MLAGIIRAHHHAGDPRFPDGVGAGRRPSLVAARLERHVQRGAVQIPAFSGPDRLHLRVRCAKCPVKALADDLRITPDNRPDDRVGTHLPPPLLC